MLAASVAQGQSSVSHGAQASNEHVGDIGRHATQGSFNPNQQPRQPQRQQPQQVNHTQPHHTPYLSTKSGVSIVAGQPVRVSSSLVRALGYLSRASDVRALAEAGNLEVAVEFEVEGQGLVQGGRRERMRLEWCPPEGRKGHDTRSDTHGTWFLPAAPFAPYAGMHAKRAAVVSAVQGADRGVKNGVLLAGLTEYAPPVMRVLLQPEKRPIERALAPPVGRPSVQLVPSNPSNPISSQPLGQATSGKEQRESGGKKSKRDEAEKAVSAGTGCRQPDRASGSYAAQEDDPPLPPCVSEVCGAVIRPDQALRLRSSVVDSLGFVCAPGDLRAAACAGGVEVDGVPDSSQRHQQRRQPGGAVGHPGGSVPGSCSAASQGASSAQDGGCEAATHPAGGLPLMAVGGSEPLRQPQQQSEQGREEQPEQRPEQGREHGLLRGRLEEAGGQHCPGPAPVIGPMVEPIGGPEGLVGPSYQSSCQGRQQQLQQEEQGEEAACGHGASSVGGVCGGDGGGDGGMLEAAGQPSVQWMETFDNWGLAQGQDKDSKRGRYQYPTTQNASQLKEGPSIKASGRMMAEIISGATLRRLLAEQGGCTVLVQVLVGEGAFSGEIKAHIVWHTNNPDRMYLNGWHFAGEGLAPWAGQKVVGWEMVRRQSGVEVDENFRVALTAHTPALVRVQMQPLGSTKPCLPQFAPQPLPPPLSLSLPQTQMQMQTPTQVQVQTPTQMQTLAQPLPQTQTQAPTPTTRHVTAQPAWDDGNSELHVVHAYAPRYISAWEPLIVPKAILGKLGLGCRSTALRCFAAADGIRVTLSVIGQGGQVEQADIPVHFVCSLGSGRADMRSGWVLPVHTSEAWARRYVTGWAVVRRLEGLQYTADGQSVCDDYSPPVVWMYLDDPPPIPPAPHHTSPPTDDQDQQQPQQPHTSPHTGDVDEAHRQAGHPLLLQQQQQQRQQVSSGVADQDAGHSSYCGEEDEEAKANDTEALDPSNRCLVSPGLILTQDSILAVPHTTIEGLGFPDTQPVLRALAASGGIQVSLQVEVEVEGEGRVEAAAMADVMLQWKKAPKKNMNIGWTLPPNTLDAWAGYRVRSWRVIARQQGARFGVRDGVFSLLSDYQRPQLCLRLSSVLNKEVFRPPVSTGSDVGIYLDSRKVSSLLKAWSAPMLSSMLRWPSEGGAGGSGELGVQQQSRQGEAGEQQLELGQHQHQHSEPRSVGEGASREAADESCGTQAPGQQHPHEHLGPEHTQQQGGPRPEEPHPPALLPVLGLPLTFPMHLTLVREPCPATGTGDLHQQQLEEQREQQEQQQQQLHFTLHHYSLAPPHRRGLMSQSNNYAAHGGSRRNTRRYACSGWWRLVSPPGHLPAHLELGVVDADENPARESKGSKGPVSAKSFALGQNLKAAGEVKDGGVGDDSSEEDQEKHHGLEGEAGTEGREEEREEEREDGEEGKGQVGAQGLGEHHPPNPDQPLTLAKGTPLPVPHTTISALGFPDTQPVLKALAGSGGIQVSLQVEVEGAVEPAAATDATLQWLNRSAGNAANGWVLPAGSCDEWAGLCVHGWHVPTPQQGARFGVRDWAFSLLTDYRRPLLCLRLCSAPGDPQLPQRQQLIASACTAGDVATYLRQRKLRRLARRWRAHALLTMMQWPGLTRSAADEQQVACEGLASREFPQDIDLLLTLKEMSPAAATQGHEVLEQEEQQQNEAQKQHPDGPPTLQLSLTYSGNTNGENNEGGTPGRYRALQCSFDRAQVSGWACTGWWRLVSPPGHLPAHLELGVVRRGGQGNGGQDCEATGKAKDRKTTRERSDDPEPDGSNPEYPGGPAGAQANTKRKRTRPYSRFWLRRGVPLAFGRLLLERGGFKRQRKALQVLGEAGGIPARVLVDCDGVMQAEPIDTMLEWKPRTEDIFGGSQAARLDPRNWWQLSQSVVDAWAGHGFLGWSVAEPFDHSADARPVSLVLHLTTAEARREADMVAAVAGGSHKGSGRAEALDDEVSDDIPDFEGGGLDSGDSWSDDDSLVAGNGGGNEEGEGGGDSSSGGSVACPGSGRRGGKKQQGMQSRGAHIQQGQTGKRLRGREDGTWESEGSHSRGDSVKKHQSHPATPLRLGLLKSAVAASGTGSGRRPSSPVSTTPTSKPGLVLRSAAATAVPPSATEAGDAAAGQGGELVGQQGAGVEGGGGQAQPGAVEGAPADGGGGNSNAPAAQPKPPSLRLARLQPLGGGLGGGGGAGVAGTRLAGLGTGGGSRPSRLGGLYK